MEKIALWVSLAANAFLLFYNIIERIRNGTSGTQKEIRDTYKERADQLERVVSELKLQVTGLNSEISSFKAVLAEKEKQNGLLVEIFQNRNPELIKVLNEIKDFLKALHGKVDEDLNISVENKQLLKESKQRHDQIDLQFSNSFPRKVKEEIKKKKKLN